jgi:hypothetical protein
VRCAVCRVDDGRVRRWHTVGGTDYGSAHPGECAGLLWEAHFIAATGQSEHEHALILWRWKRRAAEVAGAPFNAPLPVSPAEAAVTRAIRERGWEAIAKEPSP